MSSKAKIKYATLLWSAKFHFTGPKSAVLLLPEVSYRDSRIVCYSSFCSQLINLDISHRKVNCLELLNYNKVLFSCHILAPIFLSTSKILVRNFKFCTVRWEFLALALSQMKFRRCVLMLIPSDWEMNWTCDIVCSTFVHIWKVHAWKYYTLYIVAAYPNWTNNVCTHMENAILSSIGCAMYRKVLNCPFYWL